jgi:DNA-binding CsgD family transcriptional regulator
LPGLRESHRAFGHPILWRGPFDGRSGEQHVRGRRSPGRWIEHYTKSGLAERDPLLRLAREGCAFKWDEVKPLDNDENAALNEIRSCMTDGFATSVPGPGSMKAGVTMSGAVSHWTAHDRLEAKILGNAMLDRS